MDVWLLKKMKDNDVALTPDEIADYLAYKMILDRANLTEEEKCRIFDEEGAIKDNDVSLAYLLWKEQADLLKDNDVENLNELRKIQFHERFYKTGKELEKMGLSWKNWLNIV